MKKLCSIGRTAIPPISRSERVDMPCRICGGMIKSYPGTEALCGDQACREEQARQARCEELARNLAGLTEQLPRVLKTRGMGRTELDCSREGATSQLWTLCEPMIQSLLDQPENPEGGFGLVAAKGAEPGTGAGKTGLMAAVTQLWARASAEASIRVYGFSVPSKWAPLWVNWEAKLDEIRVAFGDGWRSVEFMDQLKEAPLLVLDDLGAELARQDSWGDTRLYAVLEARNSAQRAILWTSNLTKGELMARYAKRIVSRLVGLAPAIEVPAGLPDRRFLAAKARMRTR